MGQFGFGACLVTALALSGSATSFAAPNATRPQSEKPDSDREKPDERRFEPFKPEAVTSTGTVTVGGQAISYQAIAGTLIVHPKDWDDVPRDPKAERQARRLRRRAPKPGTRPPRLRCSMWLISKAAAARDR